MRSRIFVVLAVVLFAWGAPGVRAQTRDSLSCYRGYGVERGASEGIVDIRPLADAVFPTELGCTAKLAGTGKHRRRRRDICAPAATTVTESQPAPAPVPAEALENDFTCYTVKCAGEDIAELEMEDMFGRRTLTFSPGRNRSLCVPSLRGASAPTTTTTTLPGALAPFDHLQCFNVRDRSRSRVTMDLDVLGPADLPPESRCRLHPFARQYCTPASSTTQSFGAPLLPIAGAEVAGDYLCYWLRCRKNRIPDFETTNRFGTTTFQRFRARKVCLPAVRIEDPRSHP